MAIEIATERGLPPEMINEALADLLGENTIMALAEELGMRHVPTRRGQR
jgi:hypothetical protein